MARRDRGRRHGRRGRPKLSASIGFYHLTRSPTERALGRLLVRARAGGRRAVVLVADDAAAAALDDALWSEGDAWLPHGAYAAHDRRAALCPVWITGHDDALADRTPNDATFLFLAGPFPAGGQASAVRHHARFERIFDVFDGASAPAIEAARARWREARGLGLATVTWRETQSGWEQAR